LIHFDEIIQTRAMELLRLCITKNQATYYKNMTKTDSIVDIRKKYERAGDNAGGLKESNPYLQSGCLTSQYK